MVHNNGVLTQKLLSWKGVGTRRNLEMAWRKLTTHLYKTTRERGSAFSDEAPGDIYKGGGGEGVMLREEWKKSSRDQPEVGSRARGD